MALLRGVLLSPPPFSLPILPISAPSSWLISAHGWLRQLQGHLSQLGCRAPSVRLYTELTIAFGGSHEGAPVAHPPIILRSSPSFYNGTPWRDFILVQDPDHHHGRLKLVKLLALYDYGDAGPYMIVQLYDVVPSSAQPLKESILAWRQHEIRSGEGGVVPLAASALVDTAYVLPATLPPSLRDEAAMDSYHTLEEVFLLDKAVYYPPSFSSCRQRQQIPPTHTRTGRVARHREDTIFDYSRGRQKGGNKNL